MTGGGAFSSSWRDICRNAYSREYVGNRVLQNTLIGHHTIVNPITTGTAEDHASTTLDPK
ncbi:MAG: hypothetical protein ACPG7Q_01250 [Candidatus Poseidoniaceae archaeon]